MLIHTIPDRVKITWRDDINAITEAWTSCDVTVDEFKEAILIKGLGYARDHAARAFIVDTSLCTDSFSGEVEEFIKTTLLPALADNLIKYYITTDLNFHEIAKAGISSLPRESGPGSLETLHVHGIKDAVMWLKENF